MDRFLYVLFTQLSLFAIGASLYSMWVLYRHRPSRWYGYFMTKMAQVGIIGVILFLILPSLTLHGEPRAYFYLTMLVIYSVGVLIVDKDILERTSLKQLENGSATRRTDKAVEVILAQAAKDHAEAYLPKDDPGPIQTKSITERQDDV